MNKPKTTVELELTSLTDEVVAHLAGTQAWVLATCADQRVTARSMTIVNDGLDIWFEMRLHDVKGQQISANPLVALCWNNIQIEGRAEIRGNAFDRNETFGAGNEWFCQEYGHKHPSSFQYWAAMPGEVVVRVSPILITLWKYLDGSSYRDFLIPGQRAWREAYER
jgi:hypothetical protein